MRQTGKAFNVSCVFGASERLVTSPPFFFFLLLEGGGFAHVGSIDFRWLVVMTSFREKERQVAMFRKREKKKELRETLLYRFAHGGLKGKLDRKKTPKSKAAGSARNVTVTFIYAVCTLKSCECHSDPAIYVVFFSGGLPMLSMCHRGLSHFVCHGTPPPSFYFLLLLLSYCRVYRWRCIH